LFKSTEKSLDDYALQVAPIVTGAIIGGAGIGSTLLLGALGTALIAGGAVVLTGVAIAGILQSVLVLGGEDMPLA
jgi:ABC-type transporter Mla maintaining outer membrane lipid asymmetry ATPase subunit MlaF